jgi:prepilin-type N-terminal cleavage/methylation domain-containing protein
MLKNRSKGFTLIELLVVIAIIGILSAVVLASLNTARNKGNDAAIQSDLDTIRTQAEIYYGNNTNSYGTLAWTTGASCYPATGAHMFSTAGDATIQRAMSGADGANGTGSIGCAAAGSSYVVAAQLSSNTGAYWCVDSTGVSKQVTAAFPATLASCP